MKKILVLRGGALGDFIVTLPALALLRERWPEATIELAGNATAAQLARHRGLLDTVHSQHEARWSTLYGTASLPDEFARWLREFDLVVSYWPDPEGELRRRFPLRDGQLFLSTPAMPTRAPAAAHYCEPLRELGLETSNHWYQMSPVGESASEWTGRGPPLAHARGYVAIHPGSGSPRKNWPLEKWLDLIPRLPLPVSVILGEAEVNRWSALPPVGPSNQRLGVKPLHLLEQPPLEDLVTHLAGCRLFLGHDSGVSHLAAACGARCVLLFGPTEKALWAPPAPNVRVLQRGPDLNSVSVDDVTRAVEAALADRT